MFLKKKKPKVQLNHESNNKLRYNLVGICINKYKNINFIN